MFNFKEVFYELKSMYYYIYGFFPMLFFLITTIFLFYLGFKVNNYIFLFIYSSIFLLFLLYVLYYVQSKLYQIILFRKMQEDLQKKNVLELTKKEVNMDILQNKKSYFFGYLKYILLWLIFVIIVFLFYGISRLFYYADLQLYSFIIMAFLISPYFLNMNFNFFKGLKLNVLINKKNYFVWLLYSLLFSIVFYLGYLLKSFFYLLPFYFAILIPLIIVFIFYNNR